jgi:Bifunctional DNA primase/polymerase, N-terminal/Primase C terminal 2 (PriCT-2)
MLEWALLYAKSGLSVFPVRWMSNGRCSCGKEDCGSPAKHPLTKHGEKDATTDPTRIEVWWRKWPNAGIAIATGPSGLVVLDIDGSDGMTLFRKLSVGDCPKTLIAKTGRVGGFHVFYKGTGIPASQVKGEHLDVRGSTGYVVVAPSVHATGAIYTWLNPDQPIASVPSWVAPWVASRSGRKGPAAPLAPTVETPAHIQRTENLTNKLDAVLNAVPHSPYEAERLRSALATIPPDIDGRTWFSIGAALHDLKWHVAGQDIGFEIWDDWSKRSTGKGPGNGEYRGRADLEKRWQSFERDRAGPRTTIATIYYMASQNGWSGHNMHETTSDFHTDLGNARRLVERHGEDIRFVYEWRKWIIWNGNRWEIDSDGAVRPTMSRTMNSCAFATKMRP